MAEVDEPPRSLSVPAAPIPRPLLVGLLVLVVLCCGLARVAMGREAETWKALLTGVWFALVLWSIIAFPWVLRRVFLGLRLEVEPRRLVVVPRIGLRRRIPLASSTRVVFRRGLVQHRRSTEERWYVDIVTGASDRAVDDLVRDEKASSDDALRVEVGNWDFIGAPAARCAAEWIARRLRICLVDQTGPAPVRLPSDTLDWTYAQKLKKAPALPLLRPASPPPPEFEVSESGSGRSVSWKTPDTYGFWMAVFFCLAAVTGWVTAMWEAGTPVLPTASGLVFAAFGVLLVLFSLGRRSRLSVDAQTVCHELSVFGVPYARESAETAGIEDVTWQEPLDEMTLAPGRRVVLVTDQRWLWVFARNEASARWLVGWIQQALLAA